MVTCVNTFEREAPFVHHLLRFDCTILFDTPTSSPPDSDCACLCNPPFRNWKIPTA